MKKLVRLTESDLHRIVKESVNKALNKSNSVFYDDRPSKITKVDRSNSSNKHTMSPDEIEKIHNIVSEVSVAPNGFKHRFDPNKRDGDFPLEQPEWTKDPRWQGWNGEDPEWIMKQQEKYPYGGESKQSVRVSEAQLRQIAKESVNRILRENNGFMDGVKGAMNGFRGGWKEGRGVRNAIQGFRQGAQGQQQQSINDEQQQLPIYFKGIQGWANEGIKYLQQGNYEEAMSLVDSILRNCQDIKNIIQPRNVGYENGQMYNQYWGG